MTKKQDHLPQGCAAEPEFLPASKIIPTVSPPLASMVAVFGILAIMLLPARRGMIDNMKEADGSAQYCQAKNQK